MADDFDSMFANLVRETPANTAIAQPDMPPGQKKEEPAPAPAPAPAPVVAAAETPETPEPGTEIEPPDPEVPEGEPETPETPEPAPQPHAENDTLTRLADMLAQRQQPQQAPQPTFQPPPPQFSPEEVAVLTQYQQDYPDVVRAEAMLRRQEYRALTAHIFQEVASYLAPQLALLSQVADTTAYSQLSQVVPDYDALRDPVAEWVKTQPSYLQGGMNNVIQHGTVEEISDLFGRYRQATGTPSPQPGATQAGRKAPPPPAEAAELSPQAKQAAQRLAPVNSKRSAPTQAAPASFENAFEQFAKDFV